MLCLIFEIANFLSKASLVLISLFCSPFLQLKCNKMSKYIATISYFYHKSVTKKSAKAGRDWVMGIFIQYIYCTLVCLYRSTWKCNIFVSPGEGMWWRWWYTGPGWWTVTECQRGPSGVRRRGELHLGFAGATSGSATRFGLQGKPGLLSTTTGLSWPKLSTQVNMIQYYLRIVRHFIW